MPREADISKTQFLQIRIHLRPRLHKLVFNLLDFFLGSGNIDFRLRLESVDIARNIQVEFVFLYFFKSSGMSIFFDLLPIAIGLYNLFGILQPQFVLIGALLEFAAGINEKYIFAGFAGFVEDH